MTKTPVQTDIAVRLKWARSRVFKTAADAAEALDMKPVTLRAHENGQNGVNVYDLERYARRYNVNLQWLLTGSETPEPNAAVHVELGEMIDVENEIDPSRWIPSDDPSRIRQKFRKPTVREQVPFTDPRFPAEMVEAYKVTQASPVGYYIPGSILFCITISDTGFNPGDHLLVIRERGDFTNISVRRALTTETKSLIFESLTDPDEPDVTWEATSKEELPHVSAVIIGSLTRRPVQSINVEIIKQFEEYEKSRRFGPREWKALLAEAKAVVEGHAPPSPDGAFPSASDAQEFLDNM